jgi:hypothetical protein
MDLLVQARFRRIIPADGAELLAWAVLPIGEAFYGHAGPPASENPFGPAILLHRYGKGMAAYVGLPLLSVYYSTPTLPPRNILRNVMDLLLPPRQRLVEIRAPRSVEIHLMARPGQRILHLINFHAERQRGDRRYTVEEIPPVRDIRCRVSLPGQPRRIRLQPSGRDLPWQEVEGGVRIAVPELHIHQMVVFEGDWK